jgi:hypothetical protein
MEPRPLAAVAETEVPFADDVGTSDVLALIFIGIVAVAMVFWIVEIARAKVGHRPPSWQLPHESLPPTSPAKPFWGHGIEMPTYTFEQKQRIRQGYWLVAITLTLTASGGLAAGLALSSWYWGVGAALLAFVATVVVGSLILIHPRRRTTGSTDAP